MPDGVIARGELQDNDALYTGKENGALVTSFPIPVTEATLRRGQERYTIYCAPCHGGMGDGKGIIVTRGFASPPDYYEDKRVLNAPIGHYYDVITHGYGAMYSYAARVPVRDRWAIAAYIRLLQHTRAQGQNTGPVLPGGGVHDHYTPSASVAHEGEPKGVHEGGEVTTVPGSVPHSFIPSEKSGGVQEGDQGQTPTER
jgi:mono/diheme cytochrome c family protein